MPNATPLLRLARDREAARVRLRRRLTIGSETPIVVYSGEFARWNGVHSAIAALSKLRSQGSEAHLLLLGGGRLEGELAEQTREAALRDRVHMFGRMPLEEYWTVLQGCDLGLAPFESGRNAKLGLSPLKVRDYAAAGLPVVGSDLPGLEREMYAGWYVAVPAGSIDALGAEITRTLSDTIRLRLLGEAARTFAENEYGYDQLLSLVSETACATDQS